MTFTGELSATFSVHSSETLVFFPNSLILFKKLLSYLWAILSDTQHFKTVPFTIRFYLKITPNLSFIYYSFFPQHHLDTAGFLNPFQQAKQQASLLGPEKHKVPGWRLLGKITGAWNLQMAKWGLGQHPQRATPPLAYCAYPHAVHWRAIPNRKVSLKLLDPLESLNTRDHPMCVSDHAPSVKYSHKRKRNPIFIN